MEIFSIAEKTWYVDVLYQGIPRLIACGVLESDEGLLLVDPGPTASIPGLKEQLAANGASLDDVAAVLLTHIHLDHAGATGTLVANYPAIEVYVHRRGAHHLIAPERLLASAQRIYGDKMDSLWGAFLPVQETNVHVLDGNERLNIGGRKLDVAYTPGHAIHHVSYLDRETGTAFVGDTAGMCVHGVGYVVPVAPPPDIDVAQWGESLDTLRAWNPEQLFLTHFGPATDPLAHLDEMEQLLQSWGATVRQSLQMEQEDSVLARSFHNAKMTALRNQLSGADLAPYERFGQPEASWYGLARYWRKQSEYTH